MAFIKPEMIIKALFTPKAFVVNLLMVAVSLIALKTLTSRVSAFSKVSDLIERGV